MKKNITRFLLLFLLLVSTLDALTYRDRGLYGSLSLSYVEDIYVNSGSANLQERIIQEYKLGYKGNIYSPRLLEYSLETIFRYDDITNEQGSDGSKSKIESQDYKVTANFIKNTKIPFRVFYKIVNRPTSFIYGNTVSKYMQELESKGIYGSIDLGLFKLNYSTTSSNDLFETDTSVDYRVNKNSELSISKSQKNYNLKLTYTHLDQSTTSTDTNIQRTISELYDRANISYLWKISDSLRFNANMSYFDSKYLLSESISADAYLSWSPKGEDYSASISVNTTSINQTTNDLNETSQTQDTITTAGMSQSFSYRITKNLNFTQALSYLDYESASSSGENTSINLSLNYGLVLNETTRVSIAGNISERDSKLNILGVTDINETTSDEQSFAYGIQTGLTKKIEIAESRLNINLRHSATQSSLDKNNDSTVFILSLTSKFWNYTNNNLVFNYSIDNSNYTSTTSLDEDTTSSISRISASDTLSYAGKLGIKGTTSASLGVSYSLIDNKGSKISRVIPKLNVGLSYRFGQRLMYKLNLGVYKDLSYDYLNYSGNTGLTYEIGKTSFSMTYAYNMSAYDNGVSIATTEKSKFNVKMIRRF